MTVTQHLKTCSSIVFRIKIVDLSDIKQATATQNLPSFNQEPQKNFGLGTCTGILTQGRWLQTSTIRFPQTPIGSSASSFANRKQNYKQKTARNNQKVSNYSLNKYEFNRPSIKLTKCTTSIPSI